MEQLLLLLLIIAGIVITILIILLVKDKNKKIVQQCPACGHGFTENVNFCSQCGCDLRPVTSPQPDTQTAPVNTPPVPAGKVSTGTSFFINPDESPAQPKLTLEIRVGTTVSEVEISRFPCIIGREEGECDLLLGESAVSRKHAVIELSENAFCIKDLGAANGVYVNDVRIDRGQSAVITTGSRIRMGRVLLTVL